MITPMLVLFGIMPLFGEEKPASGEKQPTQATAAKSVYEFTVKDMDGKDVKLDRYKGNVLLIVNTASK